MTSENSDIQFARRGAAGIVTLNRPKALNAVTHGMVRALAAKLRVTKPVITRALDSMGKLGLVSRRRDAADRRSVVIQRTVKGALYVEKLGDLVVAKAQELP